jgi:hypothetical protein
MAGVQMSRERMEREVMRVTRRMGMVVRRGKRRQSRRVKRSTMRMSLRRTLS